MANPIKYQKVDPITHIHKRPDMYIGSLKPRQQLKEWVSTDDGNIVERLDVIYSDGLLRIFIEALSNAIDNVWRSRVAGVKPTKIKITMDKDTGETCLWNDGLHIPIAMHEEEKIYNPELIFGHLLSGSNLDDTEERLSSGRNGLGIKLLNVFSREFNIEIADPVAQKIYKQSWRNNMRDMDPPVIRSYKNKTGYTQIRWIPDFPKFHLKHYDGIMQSLYKKYAMDAAMITNLPVLMNEEKFQYKTFADYVRLYLSSSPLPRTKVENEEEEEEEKENATENENAAKKEEIVWFEVTLSGNNSEEYKTRVAIAGSPSGEYKEIGFVNGIYTKDGGVHVDSLGSELWRHLLPRFNKTKTVVSIKDLKPYFMLFVNAWVPNPEFSSQSKTKLLAPSIQIKMETKHVNAIMKWSFVEKINDMIRSKELLSLKKTEKKQRGYKKIEGLDHANLAGGKQAKDCTLILCEGLSAKTYAIKGINVGWNGKKGRDFYGVYALRGKLLNVRNATIQSISNNREITDVIQAMGLRYNCDYRLQENIDSLQYGKIMILTDADEDGHHICSLIINLFHKMFPTLLQREDKFLWYMMTPIAKIFYTPSRSTCFYNDLDYQRALESAKTDGKIRVKYYKGLGTSSDGEIRDTFGQKVVGFARDGTSDQVIDKVFNKTLSHERKDWLNSFQPESYKVPVDTYPLSDYINQELIKFSIEDCRRSIPNLFDGLKISQRKILYSVFKRRLSYSGKSMKVAQLAGYCAEVSNYHHGEQCLYDTITRMAHDFPGSNNIPYFEKDGQFGSRSYAGKDAANARYIFTKCAPLTRLLFPEQDDVLLTYTLDDGDKVEPDYYLPILPTILGNGCTAGIGTGWSCSVPCYDFEVLAAKVVEWLEDPLQVDLEMVPAYQKFTGKIGALGPHKFQSEGRLEEVVPTKGKKKNAKMYEIKELPIGLWTNKYKEELESLLEAKKLKSMKNYSTPDTVHFVIEAADDFTPNMDNMKLKTPISTTNMVLFTDRTSLQRFDSIKSIFEIFCEKRLALYGERKKRMVKDIQQQITLDKNKMRFITEVESGDLVVFRVQEAVLLKTLVQRGYEIDPRLEKKKPKIESGQLHHLEEEQGTVEEESKDYHYLLQTPMKDVSQEKIQLLQERIKSQEERLAQIQKTSKKEMWKQDISNFLKEYRKIYASS